MGETMGTLSVSRRDVLKVSALGAAALALPFERVARAKTASKIAENKIPRPYTLPFKVPPVIDGRGGGTITIAQKMQNAVILPGVQTPIFGYNGITPGPTILARRGTPLSVAVSNELPAKHPNWGYEAWTSVHLHGSASKPQFDGYASDITRVGQTKTYQFPNNQESRTLWYHDHGVHHTAENAYMGLAAMYLMSDELEDRLPIPKGSYDLPVVIADKMFAANGSLMYDDEGHSGLYGDVMLVNGQPWPNLKVAKRKYRFRILNASLSRGLRLQLSNSAPMTVIATDGGLMPKPQTTVQLRVGMAERYEVVIDFAQYAPGTKIQLRNLGVPNSRDFDNTDKVMQFEVTADAFDAANNAVADADGNLNPDNEIMKLDETTVPGIKTVKLDLHRSNSTWKVNNTTWDDIVKSNYQTVVANPQPDEVQIWEITNKSGGWFHPTHIHLVDFKILSRNGKPPFNYELGPKDVAYVGENETVRLITKFAHQTGRYMIHCHNLPHEDHDMMTQFRVGTDNADNDPITSAPAGPIGTTGGVTVIPVVNTSTPATPTATPTAVPTPAATTATPAPAATTTTRRRR
jgi:FtsP/CotA-like multicopper oxidase with cupredoxin domain